MPVKLNVTLDHVRAITGLVAFHSTQLKAVQNLLHGLEIDFDEDGRAYFLPRSDDGTDRRLKVLYYSECRVLPHAYEVSYDFTESGSEQKMSGLASLCKNEQGHMTLVDDNGEIVFYQPPDGGAFFQASMLCDGEEVDGTVTVWLVRLY